MDLTAIKKELDLLEAAKCVKTRTLCSSMNKLAKKHLIGYANNMKSAVLEEIASIDALRFDVHLATNAKKGNASKHLTDQII